MIHQQREMESQLELKVDTNFANLIEQRREIKPSLVVW